MSRRVRPAPAAVRSQTRALAERADEVSRALREAIPVPAAPHGAAALVLMMGLPGVGKTHAARLLASRLVAAHVASDHLRGELFVAASYAPEENAAVFRLLGGIVEDLLRERHRVIVDATHLRASQRAAPIEIARRRAVPLGIVRVVADEADILERLDARSRARAAGDRSDADRRVYLAMRERGVEEPDQPYLTLRNGPHVAAEVERVARELEAQWSAAM